MSTIQFPLLRFAGMQSNQPNRKNNNIDSTISEEISKGKSSSSNILSSVIQVAFLIGGTILSFLFGGGHTGICKTVHDTIGETLRAHVGPLLGSLWGMVGGFVAQTIAPVVVKPIKNMMGNISNVWDDVKKSLKESMSSLAKKRGLRFSSESTNNLAPSQKEKFSIIETSMNKLWLGFSKFVSQFDSQEPQGKRIVKALAFSLESVKTLHEMSALLYPQETQEQFGNLVELMEKLSPALNELSGKSSYDQLSEKSKQLISSTLKESLSSDKAPIRAWGENFGNALGISPSGLANIKTLIASSAHA